MEHLVWSGQRATMGYGLVRGITTIAATHRTTQMGFSAQLDHLQWVTVTCPSALRCTPLGPSPAQTGCRTGLTGFGIMTCRRLARVSTWHSFHRALFLHQRVERMVGAPPYLFWCWQKYKTWNTRFPYKIQIRQGSLLLPVMLLHSQYEPILQYKRNSCLRG